jgi:hypothetical protein
MVIVKWTFCLEGTFIKLMAGTCQDTVLNALSPLNAELNPIYHFLALLGDHPTFHVSGLRVKLSHNRFYFIPHDSFLWSKIVPQ